VQTPDAWVDPDHQRVTVDGQPLREAPKRYVLLYKPTGYLTTYKDPAGRPTIYDLVKEPGLRYAGRLDLETSGLLILTNDTAFSDFIASPDSHVAKTYLVKASAILADEQLDRLRQGVELSDGVTRPAQVKRIRDSARSTFLEITITEGRNRQVRRMIEALGAKVLKLVRTAIGPLQIGDLQIGRHRDLTDREIRLLMPRASSGRAKQPARSARPARD
jgi:pseudouridine synthase